MLYLTPGITAYCVTLTAVLGLVMGSFLNCLAWRLCSGESVCKGRSHCPDCGHTLGTLDLIPVFSWLLLRGKCRHCGKKISARYVVTELLNAIVYVSILLRYDISWDALRLVILMSLLLVISLVDLQTFEIPNGLLLFGSLAFLALAPFDALPLRETLLRAVLGALPVALGLLLLVLLADKLMKRETMGGGDIKLFFMLGLYFGWQLSLLLLILACIFGIVFALILTKARPDTPVPFAPAISAAAWTAALVGEPLLRWYLGFFG